MVDCWLGWKILIELWKNERTAGRSALLARGDSCHLTLRLGNGWAVVFERVRGIQKLNSAGRSLSSSIRPSTLKLAAFYFHPPQILSVAHSQHLSLPFLIFPSSASSSLRSLMVDGLRRVQTSRHGCLTVYRSYTFLFRPSFYPHVDICPISFLPDHSNFCLLIGVIRSLDRAK
ncbi:hypothetical protein BDP27DRAFT_587826 [Rhodocollybia butyracea]|uniref:Uncharacterized protein n=1 Tax=Rhodocollybia butyracea TaxID=206335 RepID=A0A9P5P7Z5_9AGAR|nr:hypothetical protein BDP27DRAFT_587826 [Rhodocollybia butyracea]